MADVDCKAGKVEKGGGEGGDGRDTAGAHCQEEEPPVGQFSFKRGALSVGKDGIGDH